jgi:hypothetical protein
MESPGRRIPPLALRSQQRRVRDPPNLPYLLQSFAPARTEDYFVLAEAYALSNDLDSARAILMHLQSETELALHELTLSRQPSMRAEATCEVILRVVVDNLKVLDAVGRLKQERDNNIISFLEVLPRDALSVQADAAAKMT